MANFSIACDVLLDFEGRTIRDIGDGAGITAYGITLPYLREFDADATEDDLRNMTEGHARVVYETVSWRRLGLGALADDRVATRVLLDAANVPAHAGWVLQRALVSLGLEVDLDGVIGPATRAAANEAVPVLLLHAQVEQIRKVYEEHSDLGRWPGLIRRAAWPWTAHELGWPYRV